MYVCTYVCKCCEIHNQKSRVKSWALTLITKIKMVIDNTNKLIQTTLKYKNYKNLVAG